jgi:predicted Zn-dependent protease
MKTLHKMALLLALTLAAGSAAAQTRGDGRVSGKVLDEAGQPLENVQVKATLAGQSQPVQTKSNKKGEWSLNNIAAGQWTIEFTKDGFDPQSGPVAVEASARTPDLTVKMPKHVDRPDPGVELNAKAQEAMALMQAQKYPEARKVFEDLLAKFPDVHQLNAYIAQTYSAENNVPKALEYMRIASEKDPTNADVRLALAELLVAQGDKPAGLEMVKAVDISKVKDPTPALNVSIGLINDKKADEAVDLLTKVATQFPTLAEVYYYRGRAYAAAQKLPEAKTDLEKYVSMATPDSRELAEAKKILDQIKDAK